MDDKAKELIASSRDWLKGVGVELLAAFGPAALLALLSRPWPQHLATATAATAAEEAREGAKGEVAPIVAETTKTASATVPAIVATSQSDDPEIDAFYDRRLETVQGEFIAATPLFNAWKQIAPIVALSRAHRRLSASVFKARRLRSEQRPAEVLPCEAEGRTCARTRPLAPGCGQRLASCAKACESVYASS